MFGAKRQSQSSILSVEYLILHQIHSSIINWSRFSVNSCKSKLIVLQAKTVWLSPGWITPKMQALSILRNNNRITMTGRFSYAFSKKKLVSLIPSILSFSQLYPFQNKGCSFCDDCLLLGPHAQPRKMCVTYMHHSGYAKTQ